MHVHFTAQFVYAGVFMKTKLIVLLATLLFSSALHAEENQTDKLDLEKLEDKYWSAKDTDLSVVQNRTYTKANRYFATMSYGPLINDPYSIGRMTNLAAGYYFSERYGLEFALEQGNLSASDSVSKYKQQYGVQVDYNKFVDYKSINAIIVPFYAKMSFMDRSIVYFDMQFAAGLGMLSYESQMDKGNKVESSPAINIDFTQQLFFSNHFALRLDIKNKWSSQKRNRYQLGPSQTESDRPLSDINVQDTSILFGITYFH